MRNVLTIAGRELKSYFVSPIAYVVLTGFLLLGGWFFFNLLARFNSILTYYSMQQNPQVLQRLNLNEFVIAPLLHNLSVVLVILVPVITMRSLAEEKKAGTYELLLTSPLRVSEIVLGKFLGSFVFVAIMVALTGVYPLILFAYGEPETGVVLGGYLGLLLMATSFVAIGLLASSFTENQIIAAVSGIAGETIGALLRYLAITEHFAQMVKGVIDSKDLVYFATVIVLALFLTHRSVESVRWR